MLTNYEDITHDLDEKDAILEAWVEQAFRECMGEENSKTAPQIVEIINYRVAKEYDPKEAKMTQVRLRKFVNHYRVTGKMPVCATSKGYFISFDSEVLKLQVKSLNERSRSIKSAAEGLSKWIK